MGIQVDGMTIKKHLDLSRIGFDSWKTYDDNSNIRLECEHTSKKKKQNKKERNGLIFCRAPLQSNCLPLAATFQSGNNNQTKKQSTKLSTNSATQIHHNEAWRKKKLTFKQFNCYGEQLMACKMLHLHQLKVDYDRKFGVKFSAFLSTLEANIFQSCYILQHNHMNIVLNNQKFNCRQQQKQNKNPKRAKQFCFRCKSVAKQSQFIVFVTCKANVTDCDRLFQ